MEKQTSNTAIVNFEPLGNRVECAVGDTILDAARRAGVALTALCGGEGTCGRCKVRIQSGKCTPLTKSEREILGQKSIDAEYRLACKTKIGGNLTVYVPPDSLRTKQRLQIEERDVALTVVPPVQSFPVQLPPAELGDLRADTLRLREGLQQEHELSGIRLDFAVLHRFSSQLREYEWRGTAHIRLDGSNELVRFGHPGERAVGMAVDLGTTKIAAYLVELETGRTLAAEGLMNPQVAFGEDVMARITYAMKSEENARELQRNAVEALNELARGLCDQVGRSVEEIVEAVVVGNTAMHHLFLRLPVSQLGKAPYVPAKAEDTDVKARDIGLHIAPGAYVHLLPNIAGFVGADHVAMLMATRIPEAEDIVLGLDIGTNTEVALRAKGKLFSCATASGPAFEGAHIRDGMRAAPGAIESVSAQGEQILWQTIEDAPPVGICGSGILDAVAALRRIGILGKTGNMVSHQRVNKDNGIPYFVLVNAKESGREREVVITRKDVEAVQLAKGAIRAGIEILMREAGITSGEIDRVVLAGAFGTYLKVESALDIGLLPPVPARKVEQVGNSAGQGAKMALVSLDERERARHVARSSQYIELTTVPEFTSEFAKALYLSPHA